MKTNILTSLLFFFLSFLCAQTTVYYENFESTPLVNTDCTPTWSIVDTFSVSPINSYYSAVDQNSNTCL